MRGYGTTNEDALLLSDRRDQIRGRRRTLERRLDDGYQRIEEALREGDDVGAWEDFWIQLLREYEGVCEDFSVAA